MPPPRISDKQVERLGLAGLGRVIGRHEPVTCEKLGTDTRGSVSVTVRAVFCSGSVGRTRGGRSGPRATLP